MISAHNFSLKRWASLAFIFGGILMAVFWAIYINVHGPTSFDETNIFLGQSTLFWSLWLSAPPSVLVALGLLLLYARFFTAVSRRARIGYGLTLFSLLVPAALDVFVWGGIGPPFFVVFLGGGLLLMATGQHPQLVPHLLGAQGVLQISAFVLALFPSELYDQFDLYWWYGLCAHFLPGLVWVVFGSSLLRTSAKAIDMLVLRAVVWLSLVAGLAACAGVGPTAPTAPTALQPPHSLIFYNGHILTLETNQPTAQALLVEGEQIVQVGSNAELLALKQVDTLLVDLAGRTLMPGFVDAHTHVLNDARSKGKSLDEAQMLALRHGITTLGDLYVDQRFLWQMQDFATQGQLRVRTSLYLVYNDPCGKTLGPWYKNHPPTRNAGEMLRIGGVKIFTDGGSCGHVALSFNHADQNLGDLWLTQTELNQAVAEAQVAGYQVAIHAIGDRAVEQAQTAIAFALNGQPNTYRHRMEHVSVLRPEQVARFGELGIIPVLPGQYPSCTPFGPPLPEEYGAWEWPWAELRAQNPNLPIAWHSDYPYWSINPFVHLYGFVTRKDVYQYYTCEPQTWLQDDVLTVEQALSGMTLESAYALFREDEVGSLRPGKYADVIVLSANPLTVPAEDLRRITVLATLVGGQFVYCSPSQLSLCPNYAVRRLTPLPDYAPPVWVSWFGLITLLIIPVAFGLWRWRNPVVQKPWGGVAGSLGGALFLLWFALTQVHWDEERWGWMLLLVILGLALGSVELAWRSARSRFFWLGLGLLPGGALMMSMGLVLSNWLHYDGLWFLSLLGLLLHALGLLLFGLYSLRARVLPRLNGLPLAIGLLGGLVPLLGNFLIQMNWNWLFAFAFGGGWLVLGGLLLNFPKQIGAHPRDSKPDAQ